MGAEFWRGHGDGDFRHPEIRHNSLKGAGVPAAQAEAQAVVMAEALSVNFRDLVAKDDLKQAVGEIEQRLTAKFDLFLAKLDAKIDQQGAKTDQKIDSLSAKMDSEFAKVRGDINLLRWMSGFAITLCVTMLFRMFFVR